MLLKLGLIYAPVRSFTSTALYLPVYVFYTPQRSISIQTPYHVRIWEKPNYTAPFSNNSWIERKEFVRENNNNGGEPPTIMVVGISPSSSKKRRRRWWWCLHFWCSKIGPHCQIRKRKRRNSSRVNNSSQKEWRRKRIRKKARPWNKKQEVVKCNRLDSSLRGKNVFFARGHSRRSRKKERSPVWCHLARSPHQGPYSFSSYLSGSDIVANFPPARDVVSRKNYYAATLSWHQSQSQVLLAVGRSVASQRVSIPTGNSWHPQSAAVWLLSLDIGSVTPSSGRLEGGDQSAAARCWPVQSNLGLGWSNEPEVWVALFFTKCILCIWGKSTLKGGLHRTF